MGKGRFAGGYIKICSFGLMGVLILLGTGCCRLIPPYGRPTGPELLGQWVYEDPAAGVMILTFHDDFTYVVDYNGDGERDIWGQYVLRPQWIRMDNESARVRTDCVTPGFYKYNVNRGRLKFSTVADQCVPRRLSLQAPRKRYRAIQEN